MRFPVSVSSAHEFSLSYTVILATPVHVSLQVILVRYLTSSCSITEINIFMRMYDHMAFCDKCTRSHLGAFSHFSLAVAVDHVASQITFCLLNFLQPLNLEVTIMKKGRSSDKSSTRNKGNILPLRKN
jgi:ubiquitin C-terminal hydrolase